MSEWVVYFGLPEFILIAAGVIAAAVLAGVWLGQRRARGRAWAALVEALPDGVMLVQANGRLDLANAEARQLWGAPLSRQLEGAWAEMAANVLSSGTPNIQSLETSGSVKLEARAAALRPDRVLFVLRDLASRQQQESFYRNFIGNVSHELKTPLTIIQGHMAALGERPADAERWQTARRVVAEEAARLTQLVDNLLLLSRLEMPDFALDLQPVSLEAVVEDAILQLSDAAEARNVALSLQPETRLPRLMADRARLKQVFINLLDNAIKYNREGGSVHVRLSADGERIMAQVTDTGEGIPPQDLPHIFEKLYRVERRRGRPIEGSGLGLAIVRRIVEQHSGRISAESDADGATFTVILPIAIKNS